MQRSSFSLAWIIRSGRVRRRGGAVLEREHTRVNARPELTEQSRSAARSHPSRSARTSTRPSAPTAAHCVECSPKRRRRTWLDVTNLAVFQSSKHCGDMLRLASSTTAIACSGARGFCWLVVHVGQSDTLRAYASFDPPTVVTCQNAEACCSKLSTERACHPTVVRTPDGCMLATRHDGRIPGRER